MRLLPLRQNKSTGTLSPYTFEASAGILNLAFLPGSCRTGERFRENDSPVAQPVEGSDEWLTHLLQQLRQEKVAIPPAKTYKEQVVYYLTRLAW